MLSEIVTSIMRKRPTASQPRTATRETDLYPPVRDFLAAQGFTVRAEVHRCDVAATRGDDLVIVELKASLTLELLLQAVQRQRLTDTVYLAVPRPATSAQDARLRALRPLLRRLELGLLIVDLGGSPAGVLVVLQPQPLQRRRQAKARRALLQELAARTGDDNAGGSTRRPLVTVYREQALFIALLMHRFGAMAPRRLRELGAATKALSIVRNDVYGWFERLDHALYGLKSAGAQALERYADVVARFETRLSAATVPAPVPAVTRDAAAGTSARAARRAASR